MKYRAEIDGLRALAVIPVIFFHAGFELFSGGFVGVDIFFVISGYLITSILIEDIENKKFSIIRFYERRARRILPALFLVMFFSILLAWVLLSDTALNKFGNSVIGLSFFISNLVFWKQQGYFEEYSELNPLLHTWSLSVEEQYYLIFPIFLLLVWSFGRTKVFWIIVVMAVISLLISEWGWRNKPVANFYLTPTRIWELFIGSIAALIIQSRGVMKNNFLALLGLSIILLSIFVYDESTPFPSLYTLVPVLGVFLLILYASKETFIAKILSLKLFVAIGLISYSLYLWHQPIFAYTRIFTNQIFVKNEIRFLLIITIFLIAYLSWRFVEIPFRKKSKFNRQKIFLMSFIAIFTFVLLGFASKIAVKGNEYKLAKQLSENKFVYFENLDDRKFIEGRLMYPLKKIDSIVIGSSRTMQIDSKILEEPMFNLSVSGASIEDDIAFSLEAVAKLNVKNVYISADPWLLNTYDNQNRYKSVANLYEYWLEQAYSNSASKAYLSEETIKKKENSNNYILSSIRKKLYFQKLHIPQESNVEAIAKKTYDGLHIYSKSYEKNLRNISLRFPKLLDYSMTPFEYDERSKEKLETLVKYLQNFGVNITLVLSPYHPDLFKMMKLDKPIFLDIENWFKKFGKKNNINVIGSYNPATINCQKEEFYDGMHPKISCMKKLFSGIKKY